MDIRYTHIPVPFGAPDGRHLQAFRDALAAGDEPVHVHCIMNYRVSAFLYILDCDAGMREADARSAMQEIWDPIASDDPLAMPWREFLLGRSKSD